ncbi:MAG: helix-turn-helix domain-containing protein [Deferribacterales bacterium]
MEKSQNATLVIERLKKVKGLHSDVELAQLLEIKPNTVSTWKKRNSLDYEKIFSVCHDQDLNWIINGNTKEEYKTVANGFQNIENKLRVIIETVEEILDKNDLYMKPDKKSKLVMLLLQDAMNSEKSTIDKDKIRNLISLAS